MANMSNYLEEALLNHLFRGTNFPKPTTLYLALCEDTLDDDMVSGADLPEVSGDGYERKAVLCSPATWSAPDPDGVIKNTQEIKWENVQWEATVKSVAICDDANPGAGNVLFWGDLTKEKVVTQDDSISFAIDALTIQIDD